MSTGKTTTLAAKTRDFVDWASKWHPENQTPVLLCSLTRTAAAEIAGRDLPLPSECIGTLHSHAYRSLGCPLVAESKLEDFNKAHPAYRLSGGEVDTETPEWDRHAATSGDELSNEYHLLRARMTDRATWPSRVSAFAGKWESWKADLGLIDFTDMIDLAAAECPAGPGDPRIVIADEAQDLSALEYSLLTKWGAAAGNLIITGDPYQALYTWRGAHPEIFVDPTLPDDRRRVLGQSYRVPRAVHAAAMRWIGGLSTYRPLDYLPRDHEGLVTTSPATWKAPQRAIATAEAFLGAGKSVMILASCSFFLSPLLGELRKRGLPFANPWRSKRGDWNPLACRGVSMTRRILDFLRADAGTFGTDARPWTAAELRHWVDVVKSTGLLMHGAKAAIDDWASGDSAEAPTDWDSFAGLFEPGPLAELYRMLNDREDAGETTVGDLLTWWRSRLLPARARAAAFPLTVAEARGATALIEPPRLWIGTAHSFKGSEADVVMIFPDLSPAGYREWTRPGAPKDSIIRMFYVGLTRARETVVLCQPAGEASARLNHLLERP